MIVLTILISLVSIVNPVISNHSYHDASLVKENDWYYSFASSVVQRDSSEMIEYYTVSIFRSKDLIDWGFYKYALEEKDRMSSLITSFDKEKRYSGRFGYMNTDGTHTDYAIWAPDIINYKNKFLLFVSLHKSINDSKIAVFESDKIQNDFKFKGILVSTDLNDGEVYVDTEELIDPFPIVYEDQMYLLYGSFRRGLDGKIIKRREKMGVYMAPIIFGGGSIRLGKRHFITDYYEGCIIVPHNGRFFLFGTNGNLWNYYYQIHYACSDNIFGPYLNNEGKSIADTISYNPGTPILVTKKNDRFNGFGCPSYPVVDKKGQYWMMMHGHAPEYPPIQVDKPEKERYTFLIPLYWDLNGNPYFDVDEIQRNQIKKPAL